MFYAKLPRDIAERQVLLLDPMLGTCFFLYWRVGLATGGSAIKAIEVLVDHGVSPDSILFVNLVACPEGLLAMHKAYPQVKVITAQVDEGLNDQKYIMPGLGDFGCRYFGTVDE